MARPPGWKIKRELGRLRQQLSAIPEAIWEPFAQARHARDLTTRWPVHDGAQPGSDKIAAILIWQPHGLSQSLIRQLKYLKDNGYAPFVVSNAPVSEPDRAMLASETWRWMERPNFGYDFGGYKDAIHLIRSWNVTPERLLILNDSTWFPLHDGDDTLQRLEQSEADIAGSILRIRDQTRFLESYVFSISQRAFGHDAFAEYWDNLRITSNKYKVIRRGERGFSEAMVAAGLRIEPLFTRAAFDAHIADMDESALRRVLEYAAIMEDEMEQRRLEVLNQGDAGSYRQLISDILIKAQFYSSFPIVSAGYMGYPFMKKSQEPISALWRTRYMDAVEAGYLPKPDATIWDEMKAADGRD